MVEPPHLQAEFDARQKLIPQVFEKHCKQNYTLKIIPPKKEKDPLPGPIARPTFQILDDSGELIAFFNPWGKAECYKDEFKHFFDRIVKEIETGVEEAKRDFKGL